MFTDSEEGKTHFYGDSCKPPHEQPIAGYGDKHNTNIQDLGCCEKCIGLFGVIGCKGKSSCECHQQPAEQEWEARERLGEVKLWLSY